MRLPRGVMGSPNEIYIGLVTVFICSCFQTIWLPLPLSYKLYAPYIILSPKKKSLLLLPFLYFLGLFKSYMAIWGLDWTPDVYYP